LLAADAEDGWRTTFEYDLEGWWITYEGNLRWWEGQLEELRERESE